MREYLENMIRTAQHLKEQSHEALAEAAMVDETEATYILSEIIDKIDEISDMLSGLIHND